MTFKEFEVKIRKVIDESIDRTLMKQLADTAVVNIKTRTRKGFGVDNEGDTQTKLKGISEPYIKQRRRLKRQGKLSGETTPKKSNLTNTGDLIDSVTGRVDSKTEATVFLQGRKNNIKAKHQADDDRKFMNLSNKDLKEINKIVDTKIQKDINKQGL